MLAQNFVHSPTLAKAKRVIAEADPGALLFNLLHEPAGQLPPFLREQRRLARIGQAIVAAALIGVAVVNLITRHAHAVHLFKDPAKPLLGQRIAKPPEEWHRSKPRRRFLKSRQHIEIRRTICLTHGPCWRWRDVGGVTESQVIGLQPRYLHQYHEQGNRSNDPSGFYG